MADLKAGTTIGGTLVWTQGNFPLYPTGNTLVYKTFKVYSENDKPQAVDNDFVSKASGGEYKGTVSFNQSLIANSGNYTDKATGLSLTRSLKNGYTPDTGIFWGATSAHGTGIVIDGLDSIISTYATYIKSNWAGGWVFKFDNGTTEIPVATISTTGVITARNQVSVASSAPAAPQHLTRKDYVDAQINNVNTNANDRVSKGGDTMRGNLTAPKIYITSAATDSNQVPQLGQVVQRGIILDYGTF